MKRRRIWYIFSLLIMVMVIMGFCLGVPFLGVRTRAATVTCKSKYYVTTKINKNKLKKGQKAKVTVKISNTSGDVMNSLRIKVSLPAELKKVKGSLSKSKSSLSKKKTYSYSFYVQAKKAVTFNNKVTTSKKVYGQTTKITAKNLVKYGKKKKYTTVTFTYKKPVATTAAKPATSPAVAEVPPSYADAMVSLLGNMNTYAKRKKADFAMISNGGYNLYASDAPTKNSMLAAVDGVLIEDAFTNSDKKTMQAALLTAGAAGRKPFSIEYKSFTGNSQIVSFKAVSSGLTDIPAFTKASVYNVSFLSEVKDFMAIFDPKKFKSREEFIKAVCNTDYDLIFMDLFFGYDDNGVQKPWTDAEIDQLKKKKNGGTRKVCAYFSIGEAEDYRYYWQESWKNKSTRPEWIVEENEDWEGNYKVKYWHPDWQSILYGYLDRILAAGFDGVYLDVIDAYEYFENKK